MDYYAKMEVICVATADQIKSLVKYHVERDDDKFKTVVLQIAAHEARLGHDGMARDLKSLVEKKAKRNIVQINNQNSCLSFYMPSENLSELIVSEAVYDKLTRILNEYRNRNKLQNYGLSNRRKLLVEGEPGTGKTMTASVIASELNLPLYVVQVDKLVTKFMGETSVRMRQIFENMQDSVGVYLFDEFDAIGADRSLDNEVGEMRRILNAFLQFIEQDTSDSIIIAATNNHKMLDQALFRRFDDAIHYSLPEDEEIRRLIELKIFPYDAKFCLSSSVIELARGLSHAEIVRVCEDSIKDSILEDSPIDSAKLISLLKERHVIYAQKEA